MSEGLRRTPLDAAVRARGAKLVPFAGWEMPLAFEGVLEEHRACRESVVVFDVSHLGSLSVSGAGAHETLQWALTNDLARIEPGRAQYTHALDPTDAHVLDDVIVWWLDEDEFLVLPNAANTRPLGEALAEAVARVGETCEVDDVTGQRALLAVQGPRARAVLEQVLPAAAGVGRFRVGAARFEDADVLVAGTGYTGEDGVELHVPARAAPTLWERLLAVGAKPAGLGARDTLRLEMGYPLHGHELGPGITPLQAGLGWVVGWDKGEFRGREPLIAERERGVTRLLRGLRFDGRRFPREGYEIRADGVGVGRVTSGNFSPTLGHGIALGFLPPDVEPGSAVAVDLRGRPLPGTVVEPPFVRD